ncbi:uncharacterized protein LOC124452126 [Xenia sp. Carnegie-2017]|uniref:uncharacterized protein LOC124452126 n=1 Tax=Xenia sp. Carnegie-2017 TaxID=2897299 RepID=UPI001F04073C|nr:uncharacterized protein LOC124452126 [Xenia sp. Carnegie-2017]
MERLYRCNICLEFVSDSLQLLITHIGRVHRDEPNFHVVCGIDGCARTFKKFLSLRNHLIRKHNIVRNTRNSAELNTDRGNDDANQNHEIDNTDPEQGEEFDIMADQDNLSRANALCLLNFKDRGRVPQTVVDSFVENATKVTQTSINLLNSGITSCLKNAGIDLNNLPEVNELFDEDNPISNPFAGIDQEYLQYEYYKKEFNLVEPQKIVLGKYHTKKRRGNRLRDVEKTDDAYYIPLLESLQQLLNDESILNEVENPHFATVIFV